MENMAVNYLPDGLVENIRAEPTATFPQVAECDTVAHDALQLCIGIAIAFSSLSVHIQLKFDGEYT